MSPPIKIILTYTVSQLTVLASCYCPCCSLPLTSTCVTCVFEFEYKDITLTNHDDMSLTAALIILVYWQVLHFFV